MPSRPGTHFLQTSFPNVAQLPTVRLLCARILQRHIHQLHGRVHMLPLPLHSIGELVAQSRTADLSLLLKLPLGPCQCEGEG